MKKDIKEIITNQIIDMIKDAQETGSDFTLPFKVLGGKPKNALTGKAYRGMNSLWLGMLGIRTVATYNQWQELGYQVQKGSKSVPISVPMIGKDKKTGDSKMFGFRAAVVFSADQVLSIEDGTAYSNSIEGERVDLTERLEAVDQYVTNLSFDIRHSTEGGAYYQPANDFIHMPQRDQFFATATSTATECYYSTLLHEAAHCTGHKSRLDRLDLKNKKGYAFEELVAELSAAFLCNHLDVSSSPRADHAQYLGSWLKALSNDNDYIFKAASEAQKVVDWMDAIQESLPLEEAA
jgi:antirestriction protein ArdC